MKRTSQCFYVSLLAIFLSLASSCARKPDDAKISNDIQSKFSQDSGLSGKQLTVQASNGVVTLGGTVDNDAQRDAASRQAASVAGVKEVVNNLQVGSAPTTTAVAAPAPAPPHPTASTARSQTATPGRNKKNK